MFSINTINTTSKSCVKRQGTGMTNRICSLWLAGSFFSTGTLLLLLFHAVPRRGASRHARMFCTVLTLSGLSHWRELPVWSCAPSGSCSGEDLCGLQYTQPCLRVVNWWSVVIPLVVCGLCFDKVCGVISCLVGPVRGNRRTQPQCPPTSHPPVSML